MNKTTSEFQKKSTYFLHNVPRKEIIRDGGSTTLYAVYTVDNVDMVYTVDGVERAVWADGTDGTYGTDVAEVALRMNILLYFDCLGQKYSIGSLLCCNSNGTDGRIIPLRLSRQPEHLRCQ